MFILKTQFRLFGTKPHAIESRRIKKWFIEAVCLYRPKAIVFEYATLAPLAEELKRYPNFAYITRIVDTHDVTWKRVEDFRTVGIDVKNAWTKVEEAQRLANFNVIIGITDDDSTELRKLCPAATVITTAHPVEFKETAVAEISDRKSTFLVRFIASSLPTSKSIPFFINEVWPLVKRKFDGNVCLQIIGRTNPDHEGFFKEGVEFLPRTKTLDELFTPADVIVNPMICGSGLKIKNLEALSFGKPLITTTAGAQGMPERGMTRAFIIADDADDFSDAIVDLAESPTKCAQMSKAAKEYIARHFSRDIVYRDLLTCLDTIVN